MRFVLAGLVLGVSVGVAACGDDSTEPEDALTYDEALALVEAASSQAFDVTEDMLGDDTGIPGPIPTFTAPCTMGGTVTVDPRVSLAADGVSLAVTLEHSDCVVRHEGTGLLFTLNGAPNLGVSVTLSVMGDLGFSVDGDVDGTVRWALDDGRSGSCRMDLELQAGVSPTGLTSSLNGQACGSQIMESNAELFSL